MRHFHGFRKAVACWVVVTFCCLNIVVSPLQASLVGTADILISQEDNAARQKVMRFMAREDVVKHLHALGVEKKEAQTRVDTMTPEEIKLLSRQIDQVPAGGDAFGFIVGVAIVTFVVLIITDIIGVTDVFTFIKKR